MKLKKHSGFTLIELMVVIVIIGILISIALPNFAASQVRAKRASVKSNAKVLQIAVETYNIDNGNYPGSISAITNSSTYKIFKNPSTGAEGIADTSGNGAWRTNNDGAFGEANLSSYSDTNVSKGLVIYVGLDNTGNSTTMFTSGDGGSGSNQTANYMIYTCDETGKPLRGFLLSPGELPNVADTKDFAMNN